MVVGATGSIVGNAGLVKKIYLPREVFPLASIGAAGFMFVVQLVVLVCRSDRRSRRCPRRVDDALRSSRPCR